MKNLARFLAVASLVGVAQAQTPVQLAPISKNLPEILFDPAPLSGTMLKPLVSAEPGPVVEQVPASPPQVAGSSTAPVAATAGSAVPEAGDAATEPPAQAALEAVPTPGSQEPAAQEPTIEQPPAEEPKPKPQAKPEPAGTSVTVIVENVESSKGVVNVALCDKSLSREGCPYTQSTAAAAGFVEARFNDVPPGIYAVVGYHDVNGNDEFDKMLGVPREPYALSSKAGEMLVPGFKDAALPIKEGDNTVIIRMQRLGG